MKKFIAFLSFLVAWGSIACNAQTILTNTTLSTALTTSSGQTLTLTSATGVNAPNTADPTKATYLYIDRELMQVVAVNGTSITVARGLSGTTAATHASGALTFVIPAYLATWFEQPPPQGSCTRGQGTAQVLPVISAAAGTISDCAGSQWINGDASQTTRSTFYRFSYPSIGAVAHTGAIGTSTATTAAELYCTEIDMPFSRLVTGLAPHIGATGGTDKWIVALYDATGNLITSSALAGATVSSTAYAFQAEAFTTPYYVVGPAQYFGCVQSNGTTATLDLVTTGTGDLLLTYKSASAGTFGTLPNFTAPTAFTTLQAPWSYLY